MSRKKLIRFKATQKMPCIIQGTETDIKAHLQSIFHSKKEIILELGCGNGAYTLALAERHPAKICIGVDIQGERLWYGAKQVEEKKVTNVYFLRTTIEQLDKYFPTHLVGEIWLTFPDPYPRAKQEKKRLTHPKFLALYKKLLKKGGLVHLKTDNDKLFDYTLESVAEVGGTVLVCLHRVAENLPPENVLSVQTYFETKHRQAGKDIHYLRFC